MPRRNIIEILPFRLGRAEKAAKRGKLRAVHLRGVPAASSHRNADLRDDIRARTRCDLAVEHQGARGQRRDGGRDAGEAPRVVSAVAADETDAPLVLVGEHSPAVDLLLIDPAVAEGPSRTCVDAMGMYEVITGRFIVPGQRGDAGCQRMRAPLAASLWSTRGDWISLPALTIVDLHEQRRKNR